MIISLKANFKDLIGLVEGRLMKIDGNQIKSAMSKRESRGN